MLPDEFKCGAAILDEELIGMKITVELRLYETIMTTPGVYEETGNYVVGSEQTSFETVFENTDQYIYRVGNLNSVKLENLFIVIDGQTVNSNDVSVSVTPLDENVTAVYTANSSDWTQSTLKFSGTGVVSVAIQNGVSEAAVLNLEIVNGKNITDYSQLNNQNPVLLADITMSEGSQWALICATLYG